MIQGLIECDGFRYPRAVHRFVEKRIERWADRQFGRPPEGEESPVRYQVRFGKGDAGHEVRCELEIHHKNGGMWRALRYGAGPHESLAQCLDHLSAPQTAKLLENVLLLQRIMRSRLRTAERQTA